jgi:hypothetical protein
MKEESLNFEYIEFGKIHNASDASDFVILDYSNEDIKNAAGPLCVQFSRWLGLPEAYSTSFFSGLGNLSACLIPAVGRDAFVFCQLQCRDEGEYARSLGNSPRVGRPYAQIRYILIDQQKKEEILDAFKNEKAPYSSLYYQRALEEMNLYGEIYALKDYTVPGIERPLSIRFRDIPKEDALLTRKADQVIDFLLNIPRRYTSSFGENADLWKARVFDKDLKWHEKLQVIELVQVKLWPLTGLFTFALDYVSKSSEVFIKFYSEEQGDPEDKRPSLYLEKVDFRPPNSIQLLNKYLKALRKLEAKDPEKCALIVDVVARFFKFNFSLAQSISLVKRHYDKENLLEVKLEDVFLEPIDDDLELSVLYEFDKEKLLSL